jgi:GNAT superfamily N-acetyltransferase
VKVRRLEPEDDRTVFQSGNADLDRFFIRYAGQNQFRHHIGTTYVAVDEEERIAGFATVTPSEILTERLPATQRKRLPGYPVPVLRLARLAVDRHAQGQGVGRQLFNAMLALAQQLAQTVGCIGLVVDAKPDAVSFYESLGFAELDATVGQLGDRPEPVPMFLALAVIPARIAP